MMHASENFCVADRGNLSLSFFFNLQKPFPVSLKDMKKLIDDILTYDTSFSNHVANVRRLLQRCRIHGISISQKKFIFAKPEVKYVGFIVNTDGFKADPDKVKAIRDFPQPTNLRN